MSDDAAQWYSIRAEQPGDEPAIRAVHCRAFDRPDEAELVDALRAGGHVVLSLLAATRQHVVGHVLFSRVKIHAADGTRPALSLAPVAVLPEFQRRGIGAALIRAALDQCQQQGESVVLVLGDPAYYGHFGFTPHLASMLDCPYAGPHFMACVLGQPEAAPLAGQVEYSQPFRQLDGD